MSSSVISAPDLSAGVFTDTTSRNVAVSVRNLSKSYRIAKNAARHTSAGEAIMHKLRHPFEKVEKDTFWALNDVSFDIQKGDVVGIIGRNGAGKSTLLKILSRITEPTKGEIDLYGRVGSLLEVGTGFHPELTGRENIFLNGAILGMQKSEITRQFDAIVDFSGTEQFLDTPVKRYSSGMYVRLAFAVAAHLNPEILIVDEVLAVGDAEFQKRCLGKMQDVARSGRTVLFVSHNMATIRNLCPTTLLLGQGQVKFNGTTENAIRQYLLNGPSGDADIILDTKASYTSDLVFTRCRVLDEQGETSSTLDIAKDFYIELDTLCNAELHGVEITIVFLTSLGQPLFMCNFSDDQKHYITLPPGKHKFRVHIPKMFLAPDKYFITIIAHRPMIQMLDNHESILSINIAETGSNTSMYSTQFGNILVNFPWQVIRN